MDDKFHPAMAAIETGGLKRLFRLINDDPTLATDRSSQGHPSLLQCLVLSAKDARRKIEMANVLIAAGADLDGPLTAAGGVDNVEVAELLLDTGGAINGDGAWSPLEEALYWGSPRMIDMLMRRGATVHNLRIAAGLGRVDLVESFFDHDGNLKPEAKPVGWPFGKLSTQHNPDDPQAIINNAFVYACHHGHIDVADLLLQKGAGINVIPPGFHYPGTGLHYAALNGRREMVEFLVTSGADVNIRDEQVRTKPADWAAHGGHMEIEHYLRALETDEDEEKQDAEDAGKRP